MTRLAVAGGVYVEQCLSPPSTVLLGSGGRAAMSLAILSPGVNLHTFHPPHALDDLSAAFESLGIRATAHPSRHRLGFDYLHPLSRPRLSPVPVPWAGIAAVEGDAVLRFGCVEGSFRIDAGIAVYDPQSGTTPERFVDNGSSARRLAVVLNRGEAEALGRSGELGEAVRTVMVENHAEVVVVKCGPDGAAVFHGDAAVAHVPAYEAETIYKIGSGDVFSATFAHYWAEAGMSAAEAARLASLQTARYVESRNLPCPIDVRERSPMPRLQGGTRRVYLAAPFFNAPQLWLVDEARNALLDLGLEVFSPYHDVGFGPPMTVAPADLDGLKSCDVLLALLPETDPGTSYECGVAHAWGKPIVAYSEACRPQDPTMLAGLGASIFTDFSTALHKAAWVARG